MASTTELAALPASVLASVRMGGTLVLVTGAGCSVEAPTEIPLGSKLASDAHDLLVNENILPAGSCANKEDLSQLAGAVFNATGSQLELVARLPVGRMQAATPNSGHLAAVALLREGAMASVVTLNFDTAFSAAVSQLGGGDDITIVTGIGDHSRLADPSVIYLHGTAYSDPDEWILRSELLEQFDENRWETVIARRVLTAPVVVFAGLGSSAMVLTESLRRIRESVPHGIDVFQVDPAESSVFTKTLHLEEGRYIRRGWCSFMKDLSERLAAIQVDELRTKAGELTNRERWEEEDLALLAAFLNVRGLLGLGSLRAAWLLDSSPYVPRNEAHTELIADLILSLLLVARITGTTWRRRDAGVVEFSEGDRLLGVLAFASGRRSHRWLSLEAAVAQYADRWKDDKPCAVVVSGFVGPDNPPSTMPLSIVAEQDPNSIISGPRHPRLVSADAMRANPTSIRDLVFS